MLRSNKTRHNLAALALAGAALFSMASVVYGQQLSPAANYMTHCVGCHLPDGTGLPPDVPNLGVGFSFLVDNPEGRDFVTRVPGVTGAPLQPDAIAALLNWMVASFYPAATDFEPFTAEEILEGKKRPLHDPMKYRHELFPQYIE